MRRESETAQPLLRIERGSILVNAEPQLGNTFAVGHHFADFLVCGDFLACPDEYLLQARVYGKIISMVNDDGVPDGGHDRHRANLTLKDGPYLFPFLGLNVHALILENDTFQHRVALASEPQRYKSRHG